MTEEQLDQRDELFTTRMWKERRNIPNFTNFAISLQDEHGYLIFYPIFAFLEDAKERLKMPEYDKLFVHKSLYKKKAFEDDLTYYWSLGEDWHNFFMIKPLQKYLEHLKKLEREDPKRLLAYVYYLYLGLLSGGQILAKKRKFEEKNNAKGTHKINFRGAIDEIFKDVTEQEKMALLVESYNVFKKNNVTDFYTDEVMDFTWADIRQLKKDYCAAMNEIAKDLTEDEKMTLLVESYNVFKKNYVEDYYTDKVTGFTWVDIPQIKIDLCAAMNEIFKDLTDEKKMALLVDSYNVFKKNNVKDFYVKVMDFTWVDIRQLKKDYRAAMNEITKDLTEDDKMALLVESYNVFEKSYAKEFYTDKVTDFTGADILQIRKDFRAAMNEIAKDLTEDEKMALLVESYNVFENNHSVVNYNYVRFYKFCAIVVAFIVILVVSKYDVTLYKDCAIGVAIIVILVICV